MRRFAFTKFLGWSASRYDTFSTCKRRYFYQYYGGFDVEGNVVQINFLKKMTTLPLEIGSVTHDIFASLLRRIQKSSAPIDRKRFMDYARRKSEEASQKEFAEIHYGEVRAIAAERDIFPKVEAALGNFLDSDRVGWLLSDAATSKDAWVIEPEGLGECRIDNLKAYCKVDFLFPVGDDLVIIDWKTGKPAVARDGESLDRHSQQMRGYMIWAHFQFEKEYAHIKPIIAYLLPEYEEREVPLNEFDISEFATLIRRQTEEMYAFCKDVDENIPLPKEAFEMTTSSSNCRYCNFRELCGRESAR